MTTRKLYNVETEKDLKKVAKAISKTTGEQKIRIEGDKEAVTIGMSRVASEVPNATFTVTTDEAKVDFECGAGFCIDKNTGKTLLTFSPDCPPDKREKLILSMLRGQLDISA